MEMSGNIISAWSSMKNDSKSPIIQDILEEYFMIKMKTGTVVWENS